MIDPLEPRLLLAAVTLLDKGVLSIVGGAKRDIISVDLNAETGRVTVAINNMTASVPAAEVKLIKIVAGKGNDWVGIGDAVRAQADILGGPGNDRLRGGVMRGRLYGEDGHDTLIGGLRNDILSGGLGIDTADYSHRTDNLILSLDGRPNDGHALGRGERDSIGNDIERIIGGNGHDIITGNALRNTLQGGDGNDSLVGEAGDDVLVGGAGADTLLGGEGDDMLLGIDLIALDVLDGGGGFDSATLDSTTPDYLTFTSDILLGVEAELYTLLTLAPAAV